MLRNEYSKVEKRFLHYTTKLSRLKTTKSNQEKRGKALSKKQLQRISRVDFQDLIKNEMKLSNCRKLTVDTLKMLSDVMKQCHFKSVDFVCPLLAGFCSTIGELKNSLEPYLETMGFLSFDFQMEEDYGAFLKDLHKEAILSDPRFEEERESIKIDGSHSFMDFYNKRNQADGNSLEKSALNKELDQGLISKTAPKDGNNQIAKDKMPNQPTIKDENKEIKLNHLEIQNGSENNNQQQIVLFSDTGDSLSLEVDECKTIIINQKMLV